MGMDDVNDAYNATTGAFKAVIKKRHTTKLISLELTMIPKILFAAATIAFPVPRSFVGNNSGDSAYNTPYMMFEVKL